MNEHENQNDEFEMALEGPEALCGGCLWDINHHLEQFEYLSGASRSACELGFEKVRLVCLLGIVEFEVVMLYLAASFFFSSMNLERMPPEWSICYTTK